MKPTSARRPLDPAVRRDLSDGSEVVRAAWIAGLEPQPDETIWEWADKHRQLSSKASAETGPWRTDRTPYLREPMTALSPSSPVDTVVVVKAAQMGFTEVLLNAVGFYVDRAPCSMVLALPTKEMAEEYSRQRLDPMFEECKVLRGRMRDETRKRGASSTVLSKHFPGGLLRLIGSNSAADFRSSPAQIVLCDDRDAWSNSVGEEGDPKLLVERATLTYQGRRKVAWVSTPTFEGNSPIIREWESSDQRFYNVPCPRCGAISPMALSRASTFVKGARKFLVFNANDAEHPDAHLVCEDCHGRIEDHEREAMNAAGEWIPEIPERSERVRGYAISRLYSPIGMGTLDDLARTFVTAKHGGDETLRVFFNRDMGEPWKFRGERPKWKQIYDRRERYTLRKVPDGAMVLTAGVDVQGDRLEAMVVAWGPTLESWVIDYRVIPGEASKPETWEELDRLLTTNYQHARGALLPIRMLAIDSGDQTQLVYGWGRKHSHNRVSVCKGASESMATLISQPKKVEVNSAGRRLRRGLLLWMVGGGVAKSELYARLRLESPVEGQRYPPGFVHFPDFGPDWFQQLTAEELQPQRSKTTNFLVYRWVKIHERNEVLDTYVLARAAAAIVGIDRWEERHWIEMAESIGSKIEARAPTTRVAPARETAPPKVVPRAPRPRGWSGGGVSGWGSRRNS